MVNNLLTANNAIDKYKPGKLIYWHNDEKHSELAYWTTHSCVFWVMGTSWCPCLGLLPRAPRKLWGGVAQHPGNVGGLRQVWRPTQAFPTGGLAVNGEWGLSKVAIKQPFTIIHPAKSWLDHHCHSSEESLNSASSINHIFFLVRHTVNWPLYWVTLVWAN